jgi:uncharacterized protein
VEPKDPLDGCVGFDWDDGNVGKIWERHGLSHWAAEEVFFNEPLVRPDVDHSSSESRFFALRQTNAGRRLFISFTVRGDLIRIISARDMNRKEKRAYEQNVKKS